MTNFKELFTESVMGDLAKAKKILQKKYPKTKFQASAGDIEDGWGYDINGYRIIMEENPNTSKTVKFNIDKSPAKYKEGWEGEIEFYRPKK